MASQLQPLHDRVLLKRVEVEEKSPAGIIIPDTAKEKPVEGEVLAIGPGALDEAGKCARFRSRWEIVCCSANGLAPKSSSTVRIG
jgi:co-chaperonin GroES (HSP10)